MQSPLGRRAGGGGPDDKSLVAAAAVRSPTTEWRSSLVPVPRAATWRLAHHCPNCGSRTDSSPTRARAGHSSPHHPAARREHRRRHVLRRIEAQLDHEENRLTRKAPAEQAPLGRHKAMR